MEVLGVTDKRPPAHQWTNLVGVDLSFCKSPISEEIRDESRARQTARMFLLVLERRGIAVPDDVRARIAGCREREKMLLLLMSAVTARSAQEIFGTA